MSCIIITFSTTTAAMQMESMALREGLPGRIIPAPRSLSASCGMAWVAPQEAKAILSAAVERQGIQTARLAVMDYRWERG